MLAHLFLLLSLLLIIKNGNAADSPECSMMRNAASPTQQSGVARGDAFGGSQKLTWKAECFSANATKMRITLTDNDNNASQKQPSWIGIGFNNATMMIGSFMVTCEWQDGKISMKQRYAGAQSKQTRPAEFDWGAEPCTSATSVGTCTFLVPAMILIKPPDDNQRRLDLTNGGLSKMMMKNSTSATAAPAVSLVLARGPTGADGIAYHTARTADTLTWMPM